MVRNLSQEEKSFLTTPNILTVLRILLVPVFLAMILSHKTFHALAVFLVAGTTDILDGFAARIWHQKTRIGAILDPAADKLLLTTGFIVMTIPTLSSPHVIPLWLTMVVVGRDVAIVIGAFILFRLTNQKSFYPSLWGKISTSCQIAVVFFVLFFNAFEVRTVSLSWAYYVTLVATVFSGVHYALGGLRLLSARKTK
jgi:cardiolipin synthase